MQIRLLSVKLIFIFTFCARLSGRAAIRRNNDDIGIYFMMKKSIFLIPLLTFCFLSNSLGAARPSAVSSSKPNILFCISDDQSYAHTGANGDPVIKTPAFDRVAREGLRFVHAFCDAPTCGPSRSSILTGQPIWRLEEAGNIHSTLPAKFATYTGLLQDAGYVIGFTGKGWSPGRLEPGGRTVNPAGADFRKRRVKPPHKGVSTKDYAGNFDDFLAQVDAGKPFCFWLGTHEPHRGFQSGVGRATGKDPAKAIVPPIFPDNDIVRNDILDYLVEIETFDQQVARALKMLEDAGQLDNTIVVVTSDHGMPFPRAKASLYDTGSRVPLAIRWPEGIRKPGRDVNAFVNLSDLAPTFLEAAGLKPPSMMTARSLMDTFGRKLALERPAAYIAMERHDGCRQGGKGYPCRAIRTQDFLYIHNFEPTRWPSGSPDPTVCARSIPYGEIDTSPTKTFMMEHRNEHGVARLAELSFGMRPAEELYDLKKDPHQMNNVAGNMRYLPAQSRLREQLFDHLKQTKDPRVTGGKADWDYYPYYGKISTKGWTVDPKPE
jgi:N-sulfoglucosamine sulfohydrolase